MKCEQKWKCSRLNRFHCSGWKVHHQKQGCKQVTVFITAVLPYRALNYESKERQCQHRACSACGAKGNPLMSGAAWCSAEGSIADLLCAMEVWSSAPAGAKTPCFSLGNQTAWGHLLLLTLFTLRNRPEKAQTPWEQIYASWQRLLFPLGSFPWM